MVELRRKQEGRIREAEDRENELRGLEERYNNQTQALQVK